MSRWLRFSLRTLVVAIALVTLVASHLYTSYRLWQSEHELSRLRDQSGYLLVTDPDRIHVLPLESLEPKTWRWRLFLPQGRRYELRESLAQIPEQGLTSNFGSTSLSAGEHELTARLQRDERGQLVLMIFLPQGSASLPLAPEQTDWLTRSEGGFRTDGIIGTAQGRKSESFGNEESVVLLRVRADVKSAGGGWSSPSGPAQGILLWIEPLN